MSETKQPVAINVDTLRAQVESGKKRKELADYYGISESQMASALKQADLKIRKFHAPAFVLVTGEAEKLDSPEEISNPSEVEVNSAETVVPETESQEDSVVNKPTTNNVWE